MEGGTGIREAMEDIFGAGFQLYADLFRLPGLTEAQKKVREVCLLVQHRIASGRQHVYKDIVEQALVFTKSIMLTRTCPFRRCAGICISAPVIFVAFSKRSTTYILAVPDADPNGGSA